jgi:hypothetical protein
MDALYVGSVAIERRDNPIGVQLHRFLPLGEGDKDRVAVTPDKGVGCI